MARKKIFLYFFLLTFFLISIPELILRIKHFSFNPPFFNEDIPFLYREINQKVGIFKFDPFLFWKYRNNSSIAGWGVKVKINSLGFRDNEFSVKKDNKFRIIVLGDSCTAGFEVNLEDTYSKQLENILNREKKIKYYEVINAGIPGYTSFQGERYFSIITRKVKPNLVIVYFGTNDGGLARYPDKKLTFSRLLKMSFIRNICIKSKLAQFMFYKIYKKQENNLQIRVAPEDFKENLERIDHSGRRDGVKVLFVKPCLRYEVEKGISDNSYVPPEPYVDLFELFKGYKDKPDEIFVDHKHFTILGHKILAQKIYKHLVALFSIN